MSITIMQGDARALPLTGDSMDLIVTSPPALQRGESMNTDNARRRDLRRRFRANPLPAVQRRPGARFYVTVHDGGRTAALLGPYVSHMTALANVPRGEGLARKKFPDETEFASFGTASLRRTVPTRFGQ